MAGRFLGFVLTFAVFFILTVGFLGVVDALPEPVGGVATGEPTTQMQNSATTAEGELPVRVVAKDIKLDIVILNPASTDIKVLDDALLKGAVRYPTSGVLGVDGTVLLFGHSSYLPIVHNQNFKAFNGIQNLKTSQVISVYSGTTEYRYAVVGVRLANAEEDVVELSTNGQHLALVTCDSFATKTDRFVVTADLVGAYPVR
jgi:LPXTG-site transpeptidase (sortase) family protein